MRPELTKKQRALLECIQAHEKAQTAWTYRQLSEETGVPQPSVSVMVVTLVAKGYLQHAKRLALIDCLTSTGKAA